MRSRFVQLPATVLLSFVVLASQDLSAQKKGATSTTSPATSASTPATASGSTASTAPTEVEWLSYTALDHILDKVAGLACSDKGQQFARVVILDPPALQALQAYDSFYIQAEALNSAFLAMAPRPAAGGTIDDFADITGAVAAVAVASTTETSSSFTIQDPTAAAILLGKLRKRKGQTGVACTNFYYGGVYEIPAPGSLPPIQGKPQKPAPSVSKELDNLATTRAQTLPSILGLQGAAVTPKTCKGTAIPVQNGNGATAVSTQDPCVTAFNNIDSAYSAFLTSLSTPNSTTGQTFGDSAKQGYQLRALLQTASPATPILGVYVSVAAAGGTQQDRKNLLTALFTGDWIRYSGGVSLNAILFQIAGSSSEVLYSDLMRFRTPLTHVKSPDDNKDLNKGDNLKSVPEGLPAGALAAPVPASAVPPNAFPVPPPQ